MLHNNKIIQYVAFVLLSVLFIVAFNPSNTAHAAPLGPTDTGDSVDATSVNCSVRFLTFPTWYRGLPQEADCGVKIIQGDDAISRTIWVIGLNVVEILIQLVAYVSVGYIIVGGWRYILSNGSPDGNVRGRKTILNAVVGLIIALASVAIVNTLVGSLT